MIGFTIKESVGGRWRKKARATSASAAIAIADRHAKESGGECRVYFGSRLVHSTDPAMHPDGLPTFPKKSRRPPWIPADEWSGRS